MSVQDHIHLDLPDVPRDIDDAPLHRFSVVRRQPQISVQANVHRSSNGYTYVSRVTDSSGGVVQHRDWSIQLRVTQTELDYLVSMLGRPAEFVDLIHPNDESDHLSDIQDVVVFKISDPENLDPMLRKFNVTVQLVDKANPA